MRNMALCRDVNPNRSLLMKTNQILLIALMMFGITMPASSQAQSDAPVLVELFSSQNCPACPPADRYMGQLVNQSNVIALSCHVDYFNGSTPLSQKFCTDRQIGYKVQSGRKKLFTPQMIINGHLNAVGYDKETVSKSIAQARSENIAEIQITPKSNGQYQFQLPELLNARGPMNLWLAVYRPPYTEQRARVGEITYFNVISQMKGLGSWVGTTASYTVPPFNRDNQSGFAIFAQDPKSGRIMTAGHYKL